MRDLGTADATAARHIQFQIMSNFTSLNNQELQDLKLIVSRNLAMKKTLTNKDGYTVLWVVKSVKLRIRLKHEITLIGIDFELFKNSLQNGQGRTLC